LAESFTCYVIDLPGLGDSDWTSGTDFTFTAQARRLGLLIEALRLDAYALVAHDTGATLARLVALSQPQRVTRLAMINTEMPGHRPPWIPFYQFTAGLPLARSVFRTLLSWRWFCSSSMGMGQFYTDKTLFDAPGYIAPYVDPLIRSKRRMRGMLAYLRGIEWAVVDRLRQQHREIDADVLLLWGVNDRTFPVDLAEAMVEQFEREVHFVRLPEASLMPQEERPEEVLDSLIPFLS
ncbi:MAG: alpha/beta hydrolase, partial [Acidobacteriota bacterium]